MLNDFPCRSPLRKENGVTTSKNLNFQCQLIQGNCIPGPSDPLFSSLSELADASSGGGHFLDRGKMNIIRDSANLNNDFVFKF